MAAAVTWVRRVADWCDRRAGSVLVMLALTMGGLYVVAVYQEAQRTACQASYNAAFSSQLTIRSTLTARADQAQSDLLEGVSRLVTAKPSTNPKVNAERQADFLRLFRSFDAATEAVRSAREATPLPTIPSC